MGLFGFFKKKIAEDTISYISDQIRMPTSFAYNPRDLRYDYNSVLGKSFYINEKCYIVQHYNQEAVICNVYEYIVKNNSYSTHSVEIGYKIAKVPIKRVKILSSQMHNIQIPREYIIHLQEYIQYDIYEQCYIITYIDFDSLRDRKTIWVQEEMEL